jgi:hypothetical protein
VQVDENFVTLKDAIEALEGTVVRSIAASNVRIATGSGILTWTGGSEGNSGAIAHGLGTTPTAVLITLKAPGPEAPVGVYVDTIGSATFTARGWSSKPATGTAAFNWLAIS